MCLSDYTQSFFFKSINYKPQNEDEDDISKTTQVSLKIKHPVGIHHYLDRNHIYCKKLHIDTYKYLQITIINIPTNRMHNVN